MKLIPFIKGSVLWCMLAVLASTACASSSQVVSPARGTEQERWESTSIELRADATALQWRCMGAQGFPVDSPPADVFDVPEIYVARSDIYQAALVGDELDYFEEDVELAEDYSDRIRQGDFPAELGCMQVADIWLQSEVRREVPALPLNDKEQRDLDEAAERYQQALEAWRRCMATEGYTDMESLASITWILRDESRADHDRLNEVAARCGDEASQIAVG